MLFAVRYMIIFLGGACLGSIVNWAVYTFAWNSRPISPWGSVPSGVSPRGWRDRVPVFGWFALRRESVVHGAGYWWRPLLVELSTGLALAVLYWWEVGHLGLIQGQLGNVRIVPPVAVVHWQFISHTVLFGLMLAASWIDIDEKLIPDRITVPGTLLGLLLATIVPLSLLPEIVERNAPPAANGPPAIALALRNGGHVIGFNDPMWLEPLTAVGPRAWPPNWGAPRELSSLAIGVGCYWLWCFALATRVWRGSRGAIYAVRLIAARMIREVAYPEARLLLTSGTLFIACVWWFGTHSWAGLLTALIGLAGGGGLVWAVRLIGSAALRREAMGFGDVTLMMMLGTFLGWQACMITFFLAPFAAIFIGLAQFVLRRDDVIPFGPFLCLGAAVVVVEWAPIWMWAQQIFAAGMLVPVVLVVCLVLLGLMLALWSAIKRILFGEPSEE